MAADGLTAQAVADLVGGRLLGSGDVLLRRVRALDRATGDELTVCTGNRYRDALRDSRAGAALVREELKDAPGPPVRIVVRDPQAAIVVIMRAMQPPAAQSAGIAPSAVLGFGAKIDPSASIDHGAVIGEGVEIGARTRVGPHVVIERGVVIGADTQLDAHVVVYEGSRIGSRVHCKASAVIGGPGFGYHAGPNGTERIPHIGNCILEDDVHIGSHSCVDRGTLDDTRIGAGTRIDNHVHIAHNVQVGRNCLIMACAGIAGSTRLGDRVIMAGMAGCIDHVTLGDDVKIGAKAAVMSSFKPGEVVSGYPARPHRDFFRAMATLYQLSGHGRSLLKLVEERDDA